MRDFLANPLHPGAKRSYRKIFCSWLPNDQCWNKELALRMAWNPFREIPELHPVEKQRKVRLEEKKNQAYEALLTF